ncbi:CHAT domain-containing protein [Irpex rosettiformis]|uniref:CHAT domain-containing protein n=1 Tax=Irpex rosettiformis TaxID=378272 RepID=A0ACB8TPC7_9APHY|nr:CHAT domain-containing protein [Irpex rosettiformis]
MLGTRILERTPDEDPEKPARMNNLGSAVHSRFERLGNVTDLHTVVALNTRAVLLLSDNDPDLPFHLNNLGYALQSQFEHLGDIADLHEAIALKTRALDFIPDDSPQKALLLSKLGTAVQLRFKYLGNFADLEQAIACKASSVEHTPNSHPDKPLRLNNLGISLQGRFERTGNLEDLQAAITAYTSAADLTPDSHTDKASWLCNLGTALQSQFERLGSIPDIQQAIAVHTRANELTPDDHPDKPFQLTNLGTAIQSRFKHLEDLDDVEQAIALKTRAVELTPEHHPDKCSRLNNLGTALQLRFDRVGNLADLEAAIDAHTRALELTPEDRPEKALWQNNLGHGLLVRFEHVGNPSDLEAAILSTTAAIDVIPSDHPYRTIMLRELGGIYRARLNSPYMKVDDWANAMEAFSGAMQHKTGLPDRRLLAGLNYLDLLSHPAATTTPSPTITSLQAHQQVLELLPQVIWLGYNIPRRYKELADYGALANRAAADAIASAEYSLALEWLESSRTIVWGQILRLRTPLDDLRLQHPELAADLHRVSRALQQAGESELISENQAKNSYSLTLKYEKLLTRIRELEGFEAFLRPRKVSQLAKACKSGPIAVINMHGSRCDALLLSHTGSIVHIALPDLSFHHAGKLQKQLWSVLKEKRLLSRSRDVERDDGEYRGAKPRNWKASGPDPMQTILADLWKQVVSPIVDNLIQKSTPNVDGKLPHITWCPTGPLVFLPLHAAGVYSDSECPSQTAMNVVVSSYTPTLEALLRPRPPTTLPASTNVDHYPRVLVVAQPDTPGHTRIPGAQKEADTVHSIFDEASILSNDKGTVDAVLHGMQTHDWVHFACHGVQQPGNPLNCWFALYDDRLTLSRLMSQSFGADLAVLSACQTATGDESLPEEAVHLAAGMLTIGYRNVVGTLWSIYDRSAPILTKRFYEIMSEQLAAGDDPVQPAYALHGAIQAIQEEYGVQDFVRWVPFVHFGM